MARSNRAPFGSAGRKAYQRAAFVAANGSGPTLGALTLNGTLRQGVAASGITITGATAGSTVALSIAGLTISGSGTTRTVSGTPTASGNISATETLAGASNSPRSTYLGAVAPGAFVLPAFTTAKYDGDSRTANAGGRAVSASVLTASTNGGGANGAGQMAGLIQALCGNKYLLMEGYQHAIGATSTLGMLYREQSTSIAGTGNPAYDILYAAAPGTTIQNGPETKFSTGSDGLSTPLTQAGKHIISASVGVNDAGNYYNKPATQSKSLATIAQIADAMGAAGKIWYVGDEFARGNQFYSMEAYTPSGGTVQVTAATNFLDGESFGAVGVVGQFASGNPRPLTKVSSAPGQDQYTVTAGGLYTFGGTAPTSVNITYNGLTGTYRGTYDGLRIISEWMKSSAPNFVSAINSVDYGVPGLLYNRPWVRIANTFAASVDSSTGAAQTAKPGTQDTQQLHGTMASAYLAATAFKAKIDADYPSAPSLDTKPTRNNWRAAVGTASTATYSGTLPVTMRTGFTTTAAPTLVSVARVPIGKVDTSTGAITGTGITSGSLNFATGAWTITFATTSTVAVNAAIWFEQDIGNYDLVNMVEGTVGRNTLNNALLDMTVAVGTGVTSGSGTSSITGIANSAIPYGWTFADGTTNPVNTAIANGTVRVTTGTETTAEGYPRFVWEADGIHTATIRLGLTTGAIGSINSVFTSGDYIFAGAGHRYDKHSTIGRCYGNNGFSLSASTTATGGVTRPSNTGDQTVTSLFTTVGDGGTYSQDDMLLNLAGGTLSLYRVSPVISTAGVTTFGTTVVTISNSAPANLPFAFRMGISRPQYRRRNDVQ